MSSPGDTPPPGDTHSPETERNWQSQLTGVKLPLQAPPPPPGREGVGQGQKDSQPPLPHHGGGDSRGKRGKIVALLIQPAWGDKAQ